MEINGVTINHFYDLGHHDYDYESHVFIGSPNAYTEEEINLLTDEWIGALKTCQTEAEVIANKIYEEVLETLFMKFAGRARIFSDTKYWPYSEDESDIDLRVVLEQMQAVFYEHRMVAYFSPKTGYREFRPQYITSFIVLAEECGVDTAKVTQAYEDYVVLAHQYKNLYVIKNMMVYRDNDDAANLIGISM